ncbi:hypothetical protein VP01_3728g1 [Puccinia sorghi]|uniref:Uncharacterized protein n=1 Tax=Puccinia sorghi TaxID=27349 RepID=A0A0L6UU05_9BASI|nr:hypothetical protein VP01_3728g1 [Puccinia sorghi]
MSFIPGLDDKIHFELLPHLIPQPNNSSHAHRSPYYSQPGLQQQGYLFTAPQSGNPQIAPPVKEAPGDSNAHQCTAEQIRASVASGSAKKVKKAAENAEVARLKAAMKAAKGLVKEAETAAVETRFLWMEHNKLAKNPGFMAFSKFFVQNHEQNKDFPLLAKLKNDTLLRQYCALMGV